MLGRPREQGGRARQLLRPQKRPGEGKRTEGPPATHPANYLHKLLIQHVGPGMTSMGGLLRKAPQLYSVLWRSAGERVTRHVSIAPTRPRPSCPGARL